jgi:hypothetical protein
MYRRDRPLVPEFAGAEALYLRYGLEDFDGECLAVTAIKFPCMSVNRGTLSEPEDVLFSQTGALNGLGAVECLVADIPAEVTQAQGPAYQFYVRHVPDPDNYSHSEIWSVQASNRDTPKAPSNSVKLEYRVRLSRRITRDGVRIPAGRNRAGQ